MILLLSLLLHTSSTHLAPDHKLYPVVLVPGIFGSQIDGWIDKDEAPHYFCQKKSGGWVTLWLCLECMVPKVLDCWVDNMLLNFTNGDFKDRDGVQSRVNDFGGTEGIENLDKNGYYPYFRDLIMGITSIPGYKRGMNLRAAPYDYRYAPNSSTGRTYMVRLRKLIEETYEINGDMPVNVICHSMGNLYMMEFLRSVDKKWKKKYIKRYVAVSGVFGGSVKSLRALMSGEIESIPRVLVNALQVRKFQRTFQSIYWLLPRPSLWGKDEPIAFTGEKNYTIHQIKDMFDDVGYPLGKDIIDSVRNISDLAEPGVDVHCLHGTNITTPSGFRWKTGGYFPDYQPIELEGPGDGTVNIRSLVLCKNFKQLKDYKTYSGKEAGDHMGILLNPHVIDYIKELLIGDMNPSLDL